LAEAFKIYQTEIAVGADVIAGDCLHPLLRPADARIDGGVKDA
jgi:hypothetical protein